MMGMMGTGVLVVMAVLMVKGYYHYYGDVTITSLPESSAVPQQQVGVPSVFMGGYPLATAGVPGLVQRLVQGVSGYLRGYVDVPSSSEGGLHPSIPRVVSTGGMVGVGSGGGGYQSSDENDKDDGMKIIYKGHLKDHHNNNSISTLASSSVTSATAIIGGIKENNGSSPLKRYNSIASLLSSLPMMALEKVPPYLVTSCHITSYHILLPF